ncbi:MAG: hypothetical protein IJG00_04425 [Clostridia bacterium]|nr:hypothetical protein [Clostridia bacterium]
MSEIKIILYSNGCPKCEILKKKLKEKNIVFKENNNIEKLISMNIKTLPMLKIVEKTNDNSKEKFLNFVEANSWVNNQQSYNPLKARKLTGGLTNGD